MENTRSNNLDLGVLTKALLAWMLPYQKLWYLSGCRKLNRSILKSRMVGMTTFLAREALVNAAETGRHKVFLADTKAQALIARDCMVQFAMEACGVRIEGNPLILANGAEIHFVSPLSKNWEDIPGDIVVDEYFFLRKFKRCKAILSERDDGWRQTFASSFNKNAATARGSWKFDTSGVSNAQLASGYVCGDGVWRHEVTVINAKAGGCYWLDIPELRNSFSPDEFDELFMCRFQTGESAP